MFPHLYSLSTKHNESTKKIYTYHYTNKPRTQKKSGKFAHKKSRTNNFSRVIHPPWKWWRPWGMGVGENINTQPCLHGLKCFSAVELRQWLSMRLWGGFRA